MIRRYVFDPFLKNNVKHKNSQVHKWQLKFHQLPAQWNTQPVTMHKQFKIKVYNGNVNKS